MSLPPPKRGLDLRRCVWRLACDVKEDRLNQFSELQTQIYSASRESPFDYLGMMQLWKGLYYLLWKEDDEGLQRSLAQRTASLMYLLPGPDDEGDAAETLATSRTHQKSEENRDSPLPGASGNSGSSSDSDAQSGAESEHTASSPPQEGENTIRGLTGDEDTSEDSPEYGGQSTLFLRCGLETLCREWTNIDYLRRDKFLYLVRCLVRVLCVQILQCPSDSDESENLMSTFVLVILSNGRISSMLTPATLVMQFADVWCESVRWAMKRVIRDGSAVEAAQTGGMTKELFCFLFLPWLEFVATTPNANLAAHVGDSVFEDMTDYTYEPPFNFGDYIGNGTSEGTADKAEPDARTAPKEGPEADNTTPSISHLDFLSIVFIFAANDESQNQKVLQHIAEELDAYQSWWAEDGRPAFLQESSGDKEADAGARRRSERQQGDKPPKHHRREPRKADLEARELKEKINAMVYRQAQGDIENLERNEEGVLEYHPRLQHKRERNLLYRYGIRKTALQEGREKYEQKYGETPEQKKLREEQLAVEAREELERIEGERAKAEAARAKHQKAAAKSKARKKLLATPAGDEHLPISTMIPDEPSDDSQDGGRAKPRKGPRNGSRKFRPSRSSRHSGPSRGRKGRKK